MALQTGSIISASELQNIKKMSVNSGQLIRASDFNLRKDFFFVTNGWKKAVGNNWRAMYKLSGTGPLFSSYASFNATENVPDDNYNTVSASVITFNRSCLLELIYGVRCASNTEYRCNMNLYLNRGGVVTNIGGCDDNGEAAPRYRNYIYQFIAGDKIYCAQWNKVDIKAVRTIIAYILNG